MHRLTRFHLFGSWRERSCSPSHSTGNQAPPSHPMPLLALPGRMEDFSTGRKKANSSLCSYFVFVFIWGWRDALSDPGSEIRIICNLNLKNLFESNRDRKYVYVCLNNSFYSGPALSKTSLSKRLMFCSIGVRGRRLNLHVALLSGFETSNKFCPLVQFSLIMR